MGKANSSGDLKPLLNDSENNSKYYPDVINGLPYMTRCKQGYLYLKFYSMCKFVLLA